MSTLLKMWTSRLDGADELARCRRSPGCRRRQQERLPPAAHGRARDRLHAADRARVQGRRRLRGQGRRDRGPRRPTPSTAPQSRRRSRSSASSRTRLDRRPLAWRVTHVRADELRTAALRSRRGVPVHLGQRAGVRDRPRATGCASTRCDRRCASGRTARSCQRSSPTTSSRLELTAAELERKGVALPGRVKPDTQLQVWGGGVLVFDQFGRAKLHQAEAPRRLGATSRADRLPVRAGTVRHQGQARLHPLRPARPTLRGDARRRLPCRRRLVSPSPNRITVRMYQVGFGDCFLLSFGYHASLPDGRRERHVLIDFGSTRWPKNYLPRYREIATDIAIRTKGKLDGLVITHRHKDHLGGFGDDTAAATIAALAPSLVLRSWTEDPQGGGGRHRTGADRAALACVCRRARHRPGVRGRGRAHASRPSSAVSAPSSRTWRSSNSRTRTRSTTSMVSRRMLPGQRPGISSRASRSGIDALFPGSRRRCSARRRSTSGRQSPASGADDPQYWLRQHGLLGNMLKDGRRATGRDPGRAAP